ncbi:MAG: ERF family protein [Actinobacteria bacterium]|nr:ERF family protein [Actinomycetota bacterium]
MTTNGGAELYKAIIRAQANIQPPPKTAKAMYGKYADLESVMTAVRGPLAREGLFLSQVGVREDGVNFLRTLLTHAETGQQIHSDIPLVSKDDRDPQKLGGSITYARRSMRSS